jgi:hypothetical protein
LRSQWGGKLQSQLEKFPSNTKSNLGRSRLVAKETMLKIELQKEFVHLMPVMVPFRFRLMRCTIARHVKRACGTLHGFLSHIPNSMCFSNCRTEFPRYDCSADNFCALFPLLQVHLVLWVEMDWIPSRSSPLQ